jgi:hypothetical protein
MAPPVLGKLFTATKASWADVNAVTGLTERVGAFNSDGVCEVAGARVTFDLHARFVDRLEDKK